MKNYSFNNQLLCNALSNRYRECFNKEFICKPCHMKLKQEKFKPKSGDIVEISQVKKCFFCGNIPQKHLMCLTKKNIETLICTANRIQ